MDDLIITERQNIIDIADAIRNKTGLEDEMTLADMAASINEIDTSKPELLPSAEEVSF